MRTVPNWLDWQSIFGRALKEWMKEALSRLRGLVNSTCLFPRLAPWAAIFRRFAAGSSLRHTIMIFIFFVTPLPCFRGQLFQRVGLIFSKFGDGGTAEGFEVGTAAHDLSQIVRHRAHVGAGGYAGSEAHAVDVDAEHLQSFDLDLHRREIYFFLLASQLVGRNAFDLLR